jgi:hypothetical protein
VLRNLKNTQALAESKQPAHLTSSSLLKGTSRLECLRKRVMGQRSDWPRTFPPLEKNPQSTGFSSMASSPSFSGIPETSTGNKRATLATPLSLAIQPRGDTEMQGGSNTPPASSPSFNFLTSETRRLPRSLPGCGTTPVHARWGRSPS